MSRNPVEFTVAPRDQEGLNKLGHSLVMLPFTMTNTGHRSLNGLSHYVGQFTMSEIYVQWLACQSSRNWEMLRAAWGRDLFEEICLIQQKESQERLSDLHFQ